MKIVLVSAWLLLILLADALGHFFAAVSGWTDWRLVGWAFAGSTAFVVYEFIQDRPRNGKKRAAMIAFGVFVALAGNKTASARLGLDIEFATATLGMFAYLAVGFFEKKIVKAEKISDITDVTDLEP